MKPSEKSRRALELSPLTKRQRDRAEHIIEHLAHPQSEKCDRDLVARYHAENNALRKSKDEFILKALAFMNEIWGPQQKMEFDPRHVKIVANALRMEAKELTRGLK